MKQILLTHLELHHCDHFQLLNNGLHFTVSRGQLPQLGTKTIILKKPRSQGLGDETARLKYEQNLLSKLDVKGIPKVLGFIEHGNNCGLLLEDLGPETLKDRIYNEPGLSIRDVITIGHGISVIISQLHQHHVIHKSICPENIVLRKLEPSLVGFSIATNLQREHPDYVHPFAIEGLLPYLSPEQTGRVNRDLDYRTDFYSLGATLYEALTGDTLFQAADALDWVYSHIAQEPRLLSDINPAIPEQLCRLVRKLLSKNPEDRYQTAASLTQDFQHCLEQLTTSGTIHFFQLGQNDRTSGLRLPKRLYGRQKEISKLLQAFEEVSSGKTLFVTVMGDSGIGKTAVVHEILKSIIAQKGIFVSGKSDQLGGNTPYSSLFEALQNLAQHILASSEQELLLWQQKIQNGIGVHGQIIIQIIPELSNLIRSEEPLIQLNTLENSNRFELAIKTFIAIFAQKAHPLVIFLDDLQWIDPASLGFIEKLLTDPELRHLLLIGAYRKNEVDASHPLLLTITKIQTIHDIVIPVEIPALPKKEALSLVSEMLQTTEEEIAELSNATFDLAAGNPFYIVQYLQNSFKQQLLTWSQTENKWLWSMPDVTSTDNNSTDIEFFEKVLLQLPLNALKTMQWASCLGNSFSFIDLLKVTETTPVELVNTLTLHCQHLVFPIGNSYRNALIASEYPELEINYRFIHDKIQYCAYQLIPAYDRPAYHLAIARQTFKMANYSNKDKRVFYITDHFNCGLSKVNDSAEKKMIRELNFKAATRSLESAAYKASLHYFLQALHLLPYDSWKIHYNFTLELYTLAIEAAMCCQNDKIMGELAETVHLNVSSTIDDAPVYVLKIRAASKKNNVNEAIKLGSATLEKLGVSWNKDLSHEEVDHLYKKIQKRIESIGGIGNIFRLPSLTDKKSIAKICVLSALIDISRGVSPLLFQQTIFKIVKYSLTGYTPNSGFAFACYGLLLCSFKSDFKGGLETGQLALKLAELHHDRGYMARILFILNSNINHYGYHFSKNLQGLLRAIQIGYETGDINYAGHATMHFCCVQFFSGQPLHTVLQHFVTYTAQLGSHQSVFDLEFLLPFYQLISNLNSTNGNTKALTGVHFDDKNLCILESSENKMIPFAGYFATACFHFLFRDHNKAQQAFDRAETYSKVVTGTINYHEFHFYSALNQLMLIQNTHHTDTRQIEYAQAVIKSFKTKAQYAPDNFYNKFLLLEAELARCMNHFAQAAMLYNQSISVARESGFIHEQAIAAECAGQFYLQRGHSQSAADFLLLAHSLYSQWGAAAKVLMIENEHLFLNLSSAEKGAIERSRLQKNNHLDYLTSIRLSQLISREMEINRLPLLLMTLMAKNAGANKGCLILIENNSLFVEASFPVEFKGQIQNLDMTEWCTSAIYYVARTGQPLVVDDPNLHPALRNDVYVLNETVKSILCLPVTDKGIILGILYLENTHIKDFFTGETVEFLKIITSQVAISLENCRLFSKLQKTEQTLQNQTALYASILNSVSESVMVVDQYLNIVHCNPAALRMHGFTAEELKTLQIEYWPEFFNLFTASNHNIHIQYKSVPAFRALAGETVIDQEIFVKNKKTGHGTLVSASASPLFSSSGQVMNAVVIFRDISERKKKEEKARHMAYHDFITQLPNRKYFIKKLHQLLKPETEENSTGALMFIDLDNFKAINDTLGHDIGDALLIEISQRLRSIIHGKGIAARIGGDEFGILIETQDKNLITQTSNELLESVSKPVHIESQVINSSVSIGITLFPQDGTEPSIILKNADLAMYSAKSKGRNRSCYFSHEMHEEFHRRKELSNKLQYAIQNNELEMYYQPLFEAGTGHLISVETFIRWPGHALICPPSLLISIAEQFGLIEIIGEWTIHKVCTDILSWNTIAQHITFSINISPFQFKRNDFIEKVTSIIADSGTNPKRLEFEMTETAVLSDLKYTFDTFEKLTHLGITLTLDDFGTGYSSLNYLKQLPFSKIKIDRSYIQELDQKPESIGITSGIINLAHCLNIQVVAEGVESHEQLETLRSANCDIIQGYIFSQALSKSEFSQFVKEHSE